MEYRFKPEGVCSKEMIIELDGDIIKSVKIVGGCPGNTVGLTYMIQGRKIDEVIEKLKGKEFNYRVNNIEYKTIFNKVGVLKEGWSSFYSLNKRNEGLIAVMDIGGRTTDVFTFNNGINEDEKSLAIGMMNVFSDIADKLNGQGENRKLEDIHKLLVNKIIDINDFQEVINKYADKIINEIKVNIENLKDYKIYLTGGGAEYFKEALSRVFNVEIMENNLCSNCNGSYNIGKAKGLDK